MTVSEVMKLVTRYSRDFSGNMQIDPEGSWVLAADAAIHAGKLFGRFEAAQSELAALREELDSVRAIAGEAADNSKRARGEFKESRDILQQRLTAAEQRNADMLNWLRRQANAEKGSTERSVFIEAYNALKKIAEAQHPESGASE